MLDKAYSISVSIKKEDLRLLKKICKKKGITRSVFFRQCIEKEYTALPLVLGITQERMDNITASLVKKMRKRYIRE